MRLHTDKLTLHDLRYALPVEVTGDFAEHGSHSRARAFECRLYVWDRTELNRYRTNAGNYGAGDNFAATWDQWGEWMSALYAIDPTVIIPPYGDHESFIADTRRYRDQIRAHNAPTSLRYRQHLAPWVDRYDSELSAERSALRERIAVDIARERYRDDDYIEVHGVSLVEYRDGGYWVAGRFWVDDITVETYAGIVAHMVPA